MCNILYKIHIQNKFIHKYIHFQNKFYIYLMQILSSPFLLLLPLQRFFWKVV